MFIYILGLIILIGIMGVACYAILITIRNEGRVRSDKNKVAQNPDSVVEELVKELLEIDKEHEREDILERRKDEIISTFIELHRSGDFCENLTEEEVVLFVKRKLDIGEF